MPNCELGGRAARSPRPTAGLAPRPGCALPLPVPPVTPSRAQPPVTRRGGHASPVGSPPRCHPADPAAARPGPLSPAARPGTSAAHRAVGGRLAQLHPQPVVCRGAAGAQPGDGSAAASLLHRPPPLVRLTRQACSSAAGRCASRRRCGKSSGSNVSSAAVRCPDDPEGEDVAPCPSGSCPSSTPAALRPVPCPPGRCGSAVYVRSSVSCGACGDEHEAGVR